MEESKAFSKSIDISIPDISNMPSYINHVLSSMSHPTLGSSKISLFGDFNPSEIQEVFLCRHMAEITGIVYRSQQNNSSSLGWNRGASYVETLSLYMQAHALRLGDQWEHLYFFSPLYCRGCNTHYKMIHLFRDCRQSTLCMFMN